MARLNERAYQILRQEIENLTGKDPMSQLEKELVLEQLQNLRMQEGSPASFAELKQVVIGTYPKFSQKVLESAAQANQESSKSKKKSNKYESTGNWLQLPKLLIPITVMGVGVIGLISLVNLPYPMIRKPVAKFAPILLLPSYMSMDRNYREAIAHVEQADQLINQATSAEDIEFGASKVKQAQENLDRLPVWFLGYQPQMYCSLFSCSWKFTYDEFEAARKLIGRMEAQIFQEQNAQTKLVAAERTLTEAKQEYEIATNGVEKKQAIAAWQGAIDQMREIPPNTVAAKMTEPKLTAAQRDFSQIVGSSATFQRTNNLIEAAKAFGMQAAMLSQNPPHSQAQWQQVANLWQKAIAQLEQVRVDDPAYSETQTKLAEYQSNLATVKIRLDAEQKSVKAMQEAKRLIAQWQSLNSATNPNQSQMASTLQLIINQLEIVQAGTTVFAEAQDLLNYAKDAHKN